MNFIRGWLRFFRDRVIIKTMVLIAILNFKIRKYAFGFNNACNFLRSVSAPCITPILINEGATIGTNCSIDSGIFVHNCKGFNNLRIGNNTHIGKNVFLDLRDRIDIGDNSIISMGCTLLTHFDATPSKLTQHIEVHQAPVIISSHAYIGCNVTVLSGVNIGHSSIIAAGSLVRKSVEKKTLVAGVPAVLKSHIT